MIPLSFSGPKSIKKKILLDLINQFMIFYLTTCQTPIKGMIDCFRISLPDYLYIMTTYLHSQQIYWIVFGLSEITTKSIFFLHQHKHELI